MYVSRVTKIRLTVSDIVRRNDICIDIGFASKVKSIATTNFISFEIRGSNDGISDARRRTKVATIGRFLSQRWSHRVVLIIS